MTSSDFTVIKSCNGDPLERKRDISTDVMWSSSKKSTSSHEIAAMSSSSNATPPTQPTTSANTSSAFSRLNRPGSGRLSSGSTPPSSLSPSSPQTAVAGGGGGGGGLVPEHRIRPLPPGSLAGLPAPGGGFIDGSGGLMSPEQETRRAGLKIREPIQ